MAERRSVIRSLLALSRAPHAVMDVATPGIAAVLWLDRIPPLRLAALGGVTALGAYLAVYALNDIVDREGDRQRLLRGRRDTTGYIDASMSRHPLATGELGTAGAVAWAGAWALVAAVGSLLLNPVCLAIFGLGCVLEVVYCRLCCVTPLRVLIAGVVKTLGPVAAVFAVDSSPSPLPLALLFAWVFLVEIGGQNIPSDWTDLEEDRGMGAETIPIRLGQAAAARLVLVALLLAVIAQQCLLWVLDCSHRLGCAALTVTPGVALLLVPAVLLCRSPERKAVFRLFNRASAYPVAVLAGTSLRLLV